MTNQPQALAFDAIGNLFWADYANCRVRKLNVSTGMVSTVAGGTCGYMDGPHATAQLGNIRGLALANNGGCACHEASSIQCLWVLASHNQCI